MTEKPRSFPPDTQQSTQEEIEHAEAARKAHAQALGLLESIQDAFFAVDGDWCFTYVNQHAERLWGVRREKLIGRYLWDTIPNAENTRIYREYHKVMRERVPHAFDIFAPNLGYWVGISIYPTDEGLVVYFRDISAQKDAEAAATSQKVEALQGELAGMIRAHQRQRQIAEALQQALLPPAVSNAFPGLEVALAL
jgi:PAS domain S-box-containing protein